MPTRILLWNLILCMSLLASEEVTELLDDQLKLPEELSLEEHLTLLQKNPLELSQLNPEMLSQIIYLSPITAQAIISHQPYPNPQELLKLSSIDSSLYQTITPYLTTKPPKRPTSRIKIRLITERISDLSNNFRASFTNNLAYSYGEIKLRSVLRIAGPGQHKLNYANLIASFRQHQIIIGNYQPLSPGGLIYHGGYRYLSPLKDFNVITGPIAELSLSESSTNLTGLVVRRNFRNFTATAFLAQNFYRALVQNQIVQRILPMTSETDPDTFYQVREDLIGSQLKFNYHHPGYLELNFAHHKYQPPIAPEDSNGSFYGSRITLFSLCNALILNNYYLLTEIGYNLGFGYGVSARIIGDWPNLKLNFSFYSQKKNFFAPYSRWPSLYQRKDRAQAQFNLNYKFSDFTWSLALRTQEFYLSETIPADFQLQLEHKGRKSKTTLRIRNNFSARQLLDYSTRLSLASYLSDVITINYQYQDRHTQLNHHGYLVLLGIILKHRLIRTELRTYGFYARGPKLTLYTYEPFKTSVSFQQNQVRLSNIWTITPSKDLNITGYLAGTKIYSSGKIELEVGSSLELYY
ncbi:MAG: hypothetical protein ABIK73_03950 [candidate division WOR-3 bacterium]